MQILFIVWKIMNFLIMMANYDGKYDKNDLTFYTYFSF